MICSYSNVVQRLNAKRAAIKACNLRNEEHEQILKETLSAHGLRSRVLYQSSGRITERSETGGSVGKRKSNPEPKLVLVNSLRVCYEFNNNKCTRKQNSSGCEDSKGDKFTHN